MEHVNDWCFRDIYKGGLWEDDLHVCAHSSNDFHAVYVRKITNRYITGLNNLWSSQQCAQLRIKKSWVPNLAMVCFWLLIKIYCTTKREFWNKPTVHFFFFFFFFFFPRFYGYLAKFSTRYKSCLIDISLDTGILLLTDVNIPTNKQKDFGKNSWRLIMDLTWNNWKIQELHHWHFATEWYKYT